MVWRPGPVTHAVNWVLFRACPALTRHGRAALVRNDPSAPLKQLISKFGFTPDRIPQVTRECVAKAAAGREKT
jgi:hypothetical protein